MTEARRAAVSAAAAKAGLPIVEDNPYGELWFDEAPPLPLTARNPEGCIYLGSFSKVLAPGLRLGFLVAPKAIFPKLLQAKQAADLHSPSFNQRMVSEVMKDGFLDRHVPTIRALYKRQRDAMLAALAREMKGLGVEFNKPAGGMFLWLRLPAGMDAVALLPKAVERGVAFVPGAPFYAGAGRSAHAAPVLRDGERRRDRHRDRRAGRSRARAAGAQRGRRGRAPAGRQRRVAVEARHD